MNSRSPLSPLGSHAGSSIEAVEVRYILVIADNDKQQQKLREGGVQTNQEDRSITKASQTSWRAAPKYIHGDAGVNNQLRKCPSHPHIQPTRSTQ